MKTTTEIELISIDALVPYANNARTHSPAQISKLRSSLREFGFVNPVLIDREKNVIAGHGRIEAAKAEGMTEVPCVYVDHLTEAQKKAYILADNRLALDAGWDDELLKIELDGLKDLGFDVDLAGFESPELDAIAGLASAEPLEGEDDVPEVQDDAVTKTGDVWILGEHRLLCGDATDVSQVEKLLEGRKADLVVTDPPYNVNYGNIKHPKFKVREIKNDNMSREDFRAFCQAFASCLYAFCDGILYVFGPPGEDGRVMFTVLDEQFHCSTTIIWNKDQFTLGRGKYQNKYEPCWFGWNKDGSSFTDDRTLTNVWDFPRPKSSDLHPTMKPVGLIEMALAHSSKAGDVVLDIFGGSGTTLIAAEKNGRKARLMELDPHYCDVIVRRWQDFSGKEAVLEATGQTFEQVGAKSESTNKARRPVEHGRKGVENG